MKGTDLLVCSIPTEKPKQATLGDTFCVVIDTDRKMRCTYNYKTQQVTCYAGAKHI